MKIIKIEWGEIQQPNVRCGYTHVKGDSPIGVFLITWKGWKDRPSFCLEASPFGFIDLYADSPEEAMTQAQECFEQEISKCILP